MSDSAKIRRQIGFLKKQIQRYCSSIAQTLTDYSVDAKNSEFTQLDNDQLESLRFELQSTKSNLLRAYNRITFLHDEWAILQESDANEAQLFQDYVTKYGDYRISASEAVAQLENLDLLLDDLEAEFHKRNISISSGSSDNTDDQLNPKASNYDNPLVDRPNPSNVTQQAIITPCNTSLINFVDASILSKMELPTFDGNILEFPEFSSRFATLVGNKEELDNTTKFSLLKSCLRGAALNSIQGLSLTSENYKIAMDILKTHYDDKVTIKHILYSRLADLPTCDPEGRNLHNLYNRMFALVRQFTDGNNDSNETGLGAILFNKLPLRVRSQIYDRTSNSHNLSPSELLNLLTDIVRKDTTLSEMSSHIRSVAEQDHYHTFHASSKTPRRKTATFGYRGTRKQPKPCQFCKVEPTLLSQLQHVCHASASNQIHRKQTELSMNNPISRPHSDYRPSTNRRHFTHVAASNEEKEVPDEREKENGATMTTSNSSTITTISSATTLMCTKATIFNPLDPSRSMDVTAFLDSGSSHSYICDDVAKILNLTNIRPEYVSISTFGTSTPLQLISNNHEIGIRTKTGTQKLMVKSLPTLTGNLKFAQQEKTNEGTIVKIFTARASLLIGNDYFWDIVLSKDFSYETFSNGFRLLHTNLGDILTGKCFDFKNANAFVSVLSDDSMEHPANYDILTELVRKFWTLESVGIIDNPNQKDDDVCLQFFNDNISYDNKDGRYTVKLPFKSDPCHLPDNYPMAYCRNLFQKAGMNLREYASNCKDLNDFFESNGNGTISSKQKLLGLKWDITTDSIAIQLPPKKTYSANSPTWTKRKVLKEIASIYDPLGFLAPTTLLGKRFLQSLWIMNQGWDDLLSSEQQSQWIKIMESWNTPALTFNRQFFPDSDDSSATHDLHVFVDASAHAYCAVAYIVQHREDSTTHVSLIMAKTRLAPLHQSVTIPRLELSALAVGAKLLTYITKQMDISFEEKYLWTDSTVALAWTETDKQVPIFVRNRVKTIKEHTADVSINYISTDCNPADIGTRGATLAELQELPLWWTGPSFLKQDKAQWTQSQTSMSLLSTEDQNDVESAFTAVATNNTQYDGYVSEQVIDSTRFSRWTTLLNTMTTVLRFLSKKSKTAASIFGTNPVLLIQKAEVILLRRAQYEVPPTDDQKEQLHLFQSVTNLLWVSTGRINNATLPQETRTPIFLPSKHHITTLIILDIHTKNNHCGINHTLTELRQKFWIPKGRSTVRKTIQNHCYHCKRYNAKPFTLPPFPPHPKQRVTPPQYPFQKMGMDFFGPMQYKSDYNTTEKYWMLLFTCLNSRAIYVDVVLDMTTDSVLHVLRRFIATIGCPTWIICDNALSFKKLAECYSSLPSTTIENDIIDYCTQKRIRIKFIPSLSPWQGGLYEKMIDLFKKSFRHAIGNNILHLPDIITIAKEAEAIVNTRPLTYTTDDLDHIPLRPVDFLRPSALLCGPQPADNPTDEWLPLENTQEKLITRWHRTCQTLATFWKRWSTEYLTSLREQYKTTHRTPRSIQKEEPHLGDIVLIHDATLNKGQWKTGRIVGSKDDYKRSVEIRLPSKKIITRPLNLVYKFEISSISDTNLDTTTDSSKPQTQENDYRTSNNGRHERRTGSRHPMTTRSKARHQANALTTCVSIILFCQVALATNTRCPATISTTKTILYATNCAKEGIAIALHNDTDAEKFCWFPVSCPLGAIRSEFPMKPNTTLCGESCECPKWATSCSYSESDRTTLSELPLIPQSLRSYQPYQVCSFEKSRQCDQKRQIGNFHQIQLFDDNILLVKQLTIQIKEYIDDRDFTCIDKKGWKRLPRRSITGTSRFCAKHKCTPNARLFCSYGNPLAMLVINDSESSTTLPIKAWGTVTKSFFGYRAIDAEEKQQRVSVHFTEQRCTVGGVFLRSDNVIEGAELCIHNYCVFLRNFTSQTVSFPNLLIMYDHLVSIKIWNNGKLYSESELTCKAHTICETLLCYICWERLYNPQCWNYKHYLMMLFAAGLLLTIAPTVYILLRILRFIFRILWIMLRKLLSIIRVSPNRILRFIFRILWIMLRKLLSIIRVSPNRYRQPRLPRYTNRRKRNRQRTFLACTILILFHSSTTKGCSETVAMTTGEEVCTIKKDEETCTFNHATVITLQPLQQQTCLTLNDPQNLPMGMLTIKPEGIKFRCNRKDEFYTRDHKIVSESVHRCHRAGSCHADQCHEIKETDKLKEFSEVANDSPGYTSCSSSCGGLSCDGCFFSTPSCLFHRLYATPTSSTIYTVFQCPSWELEVDAEVTLQQEDGTTAATTIHLLPGRTNTWNNIHFSLIGTIVPQLPILSSTFVTNGERTSIINPAYAGQLQSHSVGQLQCSSYHAAEQFNCYFSRNTCTCTTTVYSTTCTCSNGNIRDRMAAQPLPQISKNFIIFESNKKFYARTNVGSAIKVQIVAENLRITSVKHISRCQVESSDLSGCYSCTTGASLTLSCTSDNDEVLAQVKCDQHSHVIRCTEAGFLNTIFLMFDSPTVTAYCTAACPGGTVNFTIKGSLAFVNERIISPDNGTSNIQRNVASDISFVNELVEKTKDKFMSVVNGITSFFTLWELLLFLIPVILLVSLLHRFCPRIHHDKSH
ncbi:Pao retrotransposon peptidase [Ostertagia ostertagi]